jgi:3-carboxy-cis,cis-muconate cycloisomerase
LRALTETLRALEKDQGAIALMGRTRMQRALPIHVADKLRGWREPLERHIERLAELRPRLLVVQFGGAIGVRGDLDGKGDAVVGELARLLQLGAGPCWHVERDALAELASWASLVSGSLGKIGADVALMAQNEIGEVKLAEGGGSSAMPHKSNPVRAEALAALARFNAALLGAQHQALVHENERSGAAWTLEWLVLPQMIVATGAALRHATALCAGLRFVEKD